MEMDSLLGLIEAFAQVAKDQEPEFVERWLNGEVHDFDMDMVLIDEKHNRKVVYNKIVVERLNRREVK